jgi:hypothetical protein
MIFWVWQSFVPAKFIPVVIWRVANGLDDDCAPCKVVVRDLVVGAKGLANWNFGI